MDTEATDAVMVEDMVSGKSHKWKSELTVSFLGGYGYGGYGGGFGYGGGYGGYGGE